MEKQKRRSYTKAYKAEVVDLCRKGGKSIGAVAKDLGLAETAVRRWVQQAAVDDGQGPAGALTTAERDELSSLRRQVKTLEMERDAAASPNRRKSPPFVESDPKPSTSEGVGPPNETRFRNPPTRAHSRGASARALDVRDADLRAGEPQQGIEAGSAPDRRLSSC